MILQQPKIVNVEIESIVVGSRLRSHIDPDKVEFLANSIAEIGLRHPLSIRTIADVPTLVTGLHRLEALKSLGLVEAPCIDAGDDDIAAQLWEISENLHRAELTVLERDQHIAKWIELSELKPAHVAPEGRAKAGSINQATRELGIERTDAQRAVKVASLTDEAKEAAKEVGLDDNRTALLEAAKAEPKQQASIIRTYAEKRKADGSKLDADLKSRAAKEVAEMISEHIPGHAWDGIKANLYAAGAKNIAIELTNITGQSIMDRRYRD